MHGNDEIGLKLSTASVMECREYRKGGTFTRDALELGVPGCVDACLLQRRPMGGTQTRAGIKRGVLHSLMKLLGVHGRLFCPMYEMWITTDDATSRGLIHRCELLECSVTTPGCDLCIYQLSHVCTPYVLLF